MKKYLWAAVALMAIALLALGCAGKSTSPAGQKAGADSEDGKKHFVLKVPNSADPTSPEILIVGQEKGFFAEQGIKFEFVGVVPTNQLVASILQEKIHVNSGGHVNTLIAAIAAGAKVKAVAQKTESTQKVPHMVAIVKKDSPIKTAQDMVGKKIGTPSTSGCSGYFHLAYMRKNNIDDPKSKIETVAIKEANLEQALRQGDIHIALMHKVPQYFEGNGEFRVLFSDYDIWENRGGGTPFFFSLKFIEERPDIVRRFCAAIAKTEDWANANPRETLEITARAVKLDISKISERYYSPHAIIKPESVTVWVDLLKEFGEIKDNVPLEQIYTNEFNPNFKK